MSESELYMQESNDGYDLPRWQTQVDPLSSSTQTVHTQSPYLYPGPPPPPPPPASSQRMQTVQQGTVPPTKQPRISQLLEQEQQYNASLSPYSSGGQGQLSRSTSLGGSAGGNFAVARLRRQHPPDDLEVAFNSDNHTVVGSRQHSQLPHNYFYPPSVYQPQSLPGTGSANAATSPNDAYSDLYYNGSAVNPPKRLQPSQTDSNVNRGGRSPHRVPNTPISASPLDYSHQNQYSPTSSAYPYGVDQRTHLPTYHNRSQSQAKSDTVTTPPMSTSYSSQGPNYAPTAYSTSNYAMDTSSPHPLHPHLSTQAIGVKASLSTPSTPLSYVPSSNSHYYPHDHAMAVDPPSKRRPVGFRRVRAVHDLLPKLDAPITGRRMSHDGAYLSVRSHLHLVCSTIFLTIVFSVAAATVDHEHCRNLSDLQPTVSLRIHS